MSSGGKSLVINSQERAVSTDINRLQLFSSYDRAELYRFMMNCAGGFDDFDAGGNGSQILTLGTPLSAEIMGAGFTVRPQTGAGVFDIHVDGGSMLAVFPDEDADSSVYKSITRDPGISANGVLVESANASGSTRIDVIECTVNPVISETDTRDIFNPATSLFSPVSVTKAVQYQLTYRVRLGNPGSGFPVPVSGWLPLAVASVPTGTTTNDQITFWDVRPLVSNRVFQPYNLRKNVAYLDRADFGIDVKSAPGHAYLTGDVFGNSCDSLGNKGGLYRTGGDLYRGTPGTSLGQGIDLNDTANQSGALGTGVAYLWLLEPFNLPRWARYTDASTGSRQPRSPRGMVVISPVAPIVGTDNSPASAITLPASTGLGTSTTCGLCFGCVHVTAGNVDQSVISSRDEQFAPNVFTIPAASGGSTVATWILHDGTTHPIFASSLIINFNFQVTPTLSGGGIINLLLQDSTVGTPNSWDLGQITYTGIASAVFTCSVTKRIPFIDFAAGTYPLQIVASVSNAVFTNPQTVQIIGWKI